MTKKTKGRKPAKGNPLPTKPQDEKKHPEQWEEDRNPSRMEGQNIDRNPFQSDARTRTAADIKNLAQRLTGFRIDELSEIPILAIGTQLKQGAVYLDLREPAPIPFTATGGVVAEEHNYYTPKVEVPYALWNRLVEVLGPAPVPNQASDRPEQARPFSPGPATTPSQSSTDQSSSETSSDPMIDETVAETFPASDPPSWTTGRDRNMGNEGDDLNRLSDVELNEKARELKVQDRDGMNREQLIQAIRGQLSDSEV